MTKTLHDLKIAEKVAQDNYEAAKKQEEEAQAALDLATQQEADAEKKRESGSILFVISGAGLVSKCRFHSSCRGGPTWVVPHTARPARVICIHNRHKQ